MSVNSPLAAKAMTIAQAPAPAIANPSRVNAAAKVEPTLTSAIRS